MAGSREKAWGEKKKFREGQSEQVLDTLFFDFINLAKRLKPKVVIAENVKGLLIGSAREYLHKIISEFDSAGYYVQYFLLNAADMGVPQRRERVFFVCLRKDIAEPFLYQATLFDLLPKIDIDFNLKEVPFKDVSDNSDTSENLSPSVKKYWLMMGDNYGSLSDVHPKGSFFTEIKLNNNAAAQTLTSQGKLHHPTIARTLNKKEICRVSSWPQDYEFGKEKPAYICGMSVPPIMTARIANEVYTQWLQRIK
ncbi:DNA cytosine methyltransferase [bacterium]|nr:DNA cytosine methyltransferase [bacterium]